MNPYNDYNNDELKDTFPSILHGMLEAEEEKGNGHIVSWNPDGFSFTIHKPKVFADKIMGKYFNQTKYKSFQRQLNLYQFARDKEGAVKGIYSHRFFVRCNRRLCKFVRRPGRRTKQKSSLSVSSRGGSSQEFAAAATRACGYETHPARCGSIQLPIPMYHHHPVHDGHLPAPASMPVQEPSWPSPDDPLSVRPLPPPPLVTTKQHYHPPNAPQVGEGSLLLQDPCGGNKVDKSNHACSNFSTLDIPSLFLAETPPPVMVAEDEDASTIVSIEVNGMVADDFFDCHSSNVP
eukprot:Nitzschia sp. Nitz4//scaffold28_size193895//69482//70572//NITZ4_001648-RA/size193895-snap-gene-0.339-mRNA-1//-1//CDS//3329545931//2863//frame0